MPRRSRRGPSPHTILLVDDQEETLTSVSRLLEHEGHRVLSATSGADALGVLETEDVHLMIVDYFMPRMTGGDLVREVRTFDPDVQIILQTGYAGDRPPRVMLAELDIQGYHDKADDPERLLQAVQVGLKAYRTIRALRDRERLQSELVANCSHEFRTPLNVILGYAEMMLGGGVGELGAETTRYLKSIDQAGRDLSILVEDFLQYAKLDAGVTAVKSELIVVAALAREMTRLATHVLEAKPVTFTVALDPAVRGLRTDGTKLRTILRNLVINAAKFTSEGGITFRIAAATDVVRLEVEDTGPGIHPNDHARVFEPFRQLDGSSTRAHGGVGLGLALARKQAHLLGGDLSLHSAPGKGSTFSLMLPAAVAEVDVPDEDSRLVATA